MIRTAGFFHAIVSASLLWFFFCEGSCLLYVHAVPAFAQWSTGQDLSDAVAGTYIDGIGTVISGRLQGFSNTVPSLFVINDNSLTASVETNTSSPLQVIFPATSRFCAGQACAFAMNTEDGLLFVAYLGSPAYVEPLSIDMPWRCSVVAPCKHIYLSHQCPATPSAANANMIIASNGVFLFNSDDVTVQTVITFSSTNSSSWVPIVAEIGPSCFISWRAGNKLLRGTVVTPGRVSDVVTLDAVMCENSSLLSPIGHHGSFAVFGCGCIGVLVDVAVWRFISQFSTAADNATFATPEIAIQSLFLSSVDFRLTSFSGGIAAVTKSFVVLYMFTISGNVSIVRNTTLCNSDADVSSAIPLLIQERLPGQMLRGQNLYFVSLCDAFLYAYSFSLNHTPALPSMAVEQVYGDLFTSVGIVPISPHTDSVALSAQFNFTDCVVFVPRFVYNVTASSPIAQWEYCTQQQVTAVVYDGSSHIVVSSAPESAVVVLNTDIVVQSTFVTASSPLATVYDFDRNVAYLCVQENGQVAVEAMTLTVGGSAGPPLWRTVLFSDCSSLMQLSQVDSSILFVAGFGIQSGSTMMTVLSATNGSILIDFTTSTDTMCNYGTNNPWDCPFRSPIYSVRHQVILVQSSFSNCIYLASLVTKNIGTAEFPEIDVVHEMLHEPDSDLIVFLGSNQTEPVANSAFIFGLSMSHTCEQLDPVPSHTHENLTAVMTWSSFVPYFDAVTVAFGGVFYVNNILAPTMTFASAVDFSTVWETKLSGPVTTPSTASVGLLTVEDMVCAFYSAITCCAADDGTRLFSEGVGYWGEPIVTANSDFLFVSSSVRSFNYNTRSSWLAADSNVNFGGQCLVETAVVRGDILFVVCADQQQQLPRLFLLCMFDGGFLLGSGPTVAPSSSLLVSQTSDTVLMTAFSSTALLALEFGTTTRTAAINTTEFFCGASDETFFTFATNWNDTVLFNGASVGFAGQATPFSATGASILSGDVKAYSAPAPILLSITELLGSPCSILLPVLNATPILNVLQATLYPGSKSPPTSFALFDGTHKVIRIGSFKLSSSFCDVDEAAQAPEQCSVHLLTADQYWTRALPPNLVVAVSPVDQSRYAPVQNYSLLLMNSTLLLQVYLEPAGTFPVVCSVSSISHFITELFVYCYATSSYTLVLSHYNATSAVTVFSKVLGADSGQFVDYSMQIQLPTIYEAPVSDPNSGAIILTPFLLFLALRPDQAVVPTVGAITSAQYRNQSITLSVKGIDGDTTHQNFTADACQFINANRCPDVRVFSTELFPPKETFRTVKWSPMLESGWNSGFAKLSHPWPMQSMRKSRNQAQLQTCHTMQSSNSTLCAAPCIGNHSRCYSVVQHRLLMYMLSFMTFGNDKASINITSFSDIQDVCYLEYGCVGDPIAAAAEDFAQKPVVDVQCTVEEAIMYAPLAGNIIVHRARHGAWDANLLVRFGCTACVYFLRTGLSAAPFSWNVVAAVKSLLVVLGAYWFTQKFPKTVLYIKTKYAAMVTLLGNFRANDEAGKAAFRESIVKNFSPPELSTRAIAHRLQAVLCRHPPQEFVEFFEWNLCHDRQWIFRDKSTVPLDEMEPFSEIVFGLLRVYDAYTPSCNFESASESGAGDSWVILNNDDEDASQISLNRDDESRPATSRGQSPVIAAGSRVPSPSSNEFFESGRSWAETFGTKFLFLKGGRKPLNASLTLSSTLELMPSKGRDATHSFDEKSRSQQKPQQGTLRRQRSLTGNSPGPSEAVPLSVNSSAAPLMGSFAAPAHSLLDALDSTDDVYSPGRVARDRLEDASKQFLELRDRLPQYFEYALLPSRTLDVRLVPVPIVLVANLLYCTILVVVCVGGQLSDDATSTSQLSWFDAYQVIYFQILNSTAVGSLLVDAVVRVTLRRRDDFRLKLLLQSPYVCAAIVLILPALVTHCVIGAVLYAWIIVPLVGLPLFIGNVIQNSHFLRRNSTITILFILRSGVRVAIIFSVCTALSISFNYAALYFYQSDATHSRGPDMMKAHTRYFDAILDDYNSRSYDCLFEEWTLTVRSAMQHFSALLGIF